MARVAIVGAGPAGAAAGWHLATRGHAVTLLDRAAFPRPKTCGDWIPRLALGELARLGLAAAELEARAAVRAPISRARLVSPGGRASAALLGATAYCIPRLVFDEVLWRHAVAAGCRPLQRDVRDIAASGLLAEFDHVVDARGAHAGDPNAVALRAYWTVRRSAMTDDEPQAVQMHTDARFRRGYGWMFPVQAAAERVRVNLGVGLWADDSVRGASVADYYARFVEENPVLRRWRAGAEVERPVGCHVGLGLAQNDVARDGILRIGDAANLADPLTGDGIANAIESGRLAAEAIAAGPDRASAAAAWQARYDATFAPEFRTALRLQRALTSTPAKNAAAWLLATLPPLAHRVQSAIFGERRYR